MRILLLFLLLTTGGQLCAQQNYSIKGQVIDSVTLLPVVSATVTVKNTTKGLAPKILLTDSNGVFQISGLDYLSHSIAIGTIGYKSKTISAKIDSLHSQTDLGKIILAPTINSLKEVLVTASRPLIKQEIDRLSYDVQSDPDNKVQSVLEMISKVPMLSLDGDENILLKGSGNYKIFINGRPSSLVARNPKEALKAMPASSVKKIEVITTPPAKYDAEGLSGIINIILNKRQDDGYTGSVGVSYNDIVGMGENATITAKKNKFGITGRTYLFQDFRRYLESTNKRVDLLQSTQLLQNGTYSYIGTYSSEHLELSYEPDSLNLVTASASFFQSNYDDRTEQTSLLYDVNNRISQSYDLLNLNPQKETGVDFNINYQLGFKKKKNQLLTFSYQFQNFPNRQHDDVLLSNKVNYGQNSYRQVNSNGTREQTAQVDFVRPAKNLNFEAGVKAIVRNNFSNFSAETFNDAISGYLQDNDLSNKFNYQQDVYSAYNSWHLKLKQMEIKAGLRLEHTRVDGDFTTQNVSLSQHYSNYLPVISIQRKVKGGTFNLGYSQRISRPGIYELNPFVDRSNPQFISTGNPNLQAVINNNFELSYSAFGKGSYNVALSYSYANNTIQRLTTVVDTSSFSTYENIGKNKLIGLSTSVSYPLSNSISTSLNNQLSYFWAEGTSNGKKYENGGLQASAYLSIAYKINPTWRLSGTLNLISNSILLQGRVNGYVLNSYRISKDLFNKKLLISASLNNPYKKFRYMRTETNTDDFQQSVISQRNYRSFSLSVNYNFGSLKSEIKKNNRGINNDDVIPKSK